MAQPIDKDEAAESGQSGESFDARVHAEGTSDVLAPLVIGGEEIGSRESFVV